MRVRNPTTLRQHLHGQRPVPLLSQRGTLAPYCGSLRANDVAHFQSCKGVLNNCPKKQTFTWGHNCKKHLFGPFRAVFYHKSCFLCNSAHFPNAREKIIQVVKLVFAKRDKLSNLSSPSATTFRKSFAARYAETISVRFQILPVALRFPNQRKLFRGVRSRVVLRALVQGTHRSVERFRRLSVGGAEQRSLRSRAVRGAGT